jgi:CheY-like chemotaxis protein
MKMAKNVVLIEDDSKDVELTLLALAESGIGKDVFVAATGVEALDYLHRRGKYGEREEGLPMLVLLDIKLPLLSGLEVLREIKEHADLRAIPVVMLTSSQEESDVDESYRLGANAHVVKPVDFPEYVATVKGLSRFWTELNEPPSACAR